MGTGLFSDPSVRSAYLLTKAGVLVLAGLATWPLSKVLGPKAWWGFGAFAVILLVMTAGVVLAGGRGSEKEAGEGFAAPDIEDGDGEDEQPAEAEPVVLPIEDGIDLHPFAPADIPSVVDDYLQAAHARGIREVRLIHGRGIGVQRERVRKVLARSPLVQSFHDAPPERGGWGATIAYLRGDESRKKSEVRSQK